MTQNLNCFNSLCSCIPFFSSLTSRIFAYSYLLLFFSIPYWHLLNSLNLMPSISFCPNIFVFLFFFYPKFSSISFLILFSVSFGSPGFFFFVSIVLILFSTSPVFFCGLVPFYLIITFSLHFFLSSCFFSSCNFFILLSLGHFSPCSSFPWSCTSACSFVLFFCKNPSITDLQALCMGHSFFPSSFSCLWSYDFSDLFVLLVVLSPSSFRSFLMYCPNSFLPASFFPCSPVNS